MLSSFVNQRLAERRPTFGVVSLPEPPTGSSFREVGGEVGLSHHVLGHEVAGTKRGEAATDRFGAVKTEPDAGERLTESRMPMGCGLDFVQDLHAVAGVAHEALQWAGADPAQQFGVTSSGFGQRHQNIDGAGSRLIGEGCDECARRTRLLGAPLADPVISPGKDRRPRAHDLFFDRVENVARAIGIHVRLVHR